MAVGGRSGSDVFSSVPPDVRLASGRVPIPKPRLLAGLLALGLVLAGHQAAVKVIAACANPVCIENQHPGSADWGLGRVADDGAGQIKGYASQVSVRQGETIDLHVTVNPAQTYTVDIFRVGYYGGAGARRLLRIGPLKGSHQPACPVEAGTGMVVCHWPRAYRLQVPNTWTSGVYLARLNSASGWQNYITFVVRDDRIATFRYQLAVNTYQAYNNYPYDGTGKSLYDFNSGGPATVAGSRRAVKVSFDRPYSGSGDGQLMLWEAGFIRWAEQHGYDITYSTDLDTHRRGHLLLADRAVLDAGHDEYWTKEMFDAWQAAREAGVSLGFFGANAAYWQVRYEAEGRVMVCYRSAELDPVKGALATVNFRSPPVNRPEQGLIGVQYNGHSIQLGHQAPLSVRAAGSPVWAGTGVGEGTTIPGIVGYEMDRMMTQFPVPAAVSRTVVASSAYGSDYAEAVFWQAPSGARVFAAGTISWSGGLYPGSPGVAPDPRIQRATLNLLDDFAARGPNLPAPGSPQNLGLARVDASSVTAVWSPPAGGGPVSWYQAFAYPAGGSSASTCVTVDPGCVLSGLRANTAYTLVVVPYSGTLPGRAAVGGFATPSPPVAGPAAELVPLSPVRVMDTRPGPERVGPNGTLGPGQVARLSLAAYLPPGATAAILNVTAARASADTFITVYPTGSGLPYASNLNPRQDAAPAANLVIATLGGDRSVDLYNYAGSTDLVVDLNGYMAPVAGAGRFHPILPTRLMDTRLGPGHLGAAATLGAGQTVRLQVAGGHGIPAGATAVVANITAVDPTAPTFVTAYPAGTARPLASNLNPDPSRPALPNLAVIKLAGGAIDLYNYDGRVDLVVDVAGYFSPDSDPGGARYHALPPVRLMDTRPGGSRTGGLDTVGEDAQVDLTVLNPAAGVGAGAVAVVANLTAAAVTSPTFVTAWPAGAPRPLASNLNPPPDGMASANLAITTVGAGGAVSYYNYRGGADLLVDLNGYFG